MNIEQAIRIATYATEDLTEKYDTPYIFHLLRVLLACQNKIDNEYLVCAILYNVVTISNYTFDDLYQMGCSTEQISIIKKLTRSLYANESDYLNTIKNDSIAKTIKIEICKDILKYTNKAFIKEKLNKILNYLLKNESE